MKRLNWFNKNWKVWQNVKNERGGSRKANESRQHRFGGLRPSTQLVCFGTRLCGYNKEAATYVTTSNQVIPFSSERRFAWRTSQPFLGICPSQPINWYHAVPLESSITFWPVICMPRSFDAPLNMEHSGHLRHEWSKPVTWFSEPPELAMMPPN